MLAFDLDHSWEIRLTLFLWLAEEGGCCSFQRWSHFRCWLESKFISPLLFLYRLCPSSAQLISPHIFQYSYISTVSAVYHFCQLTFLDNSFLCLLYLNLMLLYLIFSCSMTFQRKELFISWEEPFEANISLSLFDRLSIISLKYEDCYIFPNFQI